MRKILKKSLIALVLSSFCFLFMFNANASSSSWNFKDSKFKNLGTISSTVTVDGLTLTANSSKKMSVESNTVKVDNTSYTYCLKMGGSGSLKYRSVKVPVSGNDTLKVVLQSSKTRSLVVADEDGKTLSTLTAESSASQKSYNYKGNSDYLYLYSSNSNINIFKIQVDSNSGSSSSSSSSSSSGSSSSGGSSSQGSTSSSSIGANMSGLKNYGKSQTITSTIVVESGKTYDGQGIKIIAKGLGDGSQAENQKPIFKLEKGASLKNVIIGNPGCDGVHVYGNNTVYNVIWEDVGEDALTVKGSTSSSVGTIKIQNCTLSKAYDKLFQCNAMCTVYFENIKATDIGKFVRQNGGKSFKCVWYINNCEIDKVKDSIARTDSSKTLCYYKNLKVSNCDTLWKFPNKSQVSTY